MDSMPTYKPWIQTLWCVIHRYLIPIELLFVFEKEKKWVPTYCYSILIGFYLCKWLTLHLNSEIFDFPSKEMMIHTGSCLKDVCQIIYGTGFSEPFDLDWSCRRIFLSDANISGMVSYLDKMVDWHRTLTSSKIFEKYMGNACRNSTLWPHVKSFTFSSVWDQGWAKWFTFGFIKSHLWLLIPIPFTTSHHVYHMFQYL